MENNLPEGGILLLDKKSGKSSHYPVNYIKRLIGKKTGHGGTLDPLACGLLIIAFGKATRLLEYALDSDKEYIFQIKWGSSTDTYDSEGKVISQSNKLPKEEEIRNALPHFKGKIEQIPPIFSAIKINGTPAYKQARQGLSPDLKARLVEIKELELIEHKEEQTLLRAFCSKGTYIRSLAHDICQKLNCDGHINFLKRSQASGFSLADSFSLNYDKSASDKNKILENILPPETLVRHLLELKLDKNELKKLVNGIAIQRNNLHFAKETFMRASFQDEFIGIVRVDKETIYPRKILFNHLIFKE